MDRIRASVASVRRFIDEAWSELKKVSWPTLPTTRNLTVLVFAVSLAIGVFITVFDTIFLEAVKLLSTSG